VFIMPLCSAFFSFTPHSTDVVWTHLSNQLTDRVPGTGGYQQ